VIIFAIIGFLIGALLAASLIYYESSKDD